MPVQVCNHLSVSSLKSIFVNVNILILSLQNKHLCIYKDSFGAKILSDDCIPGFTLAKKRLVVYFWKTSNISANFFSMLWVLSSEFWLVLIGAIIIFFLVLSLTRLLENYHDNGFKFLDSLYVFAAIIQAILAQSFDESTLSSSKRHSLTKLLLWNWKFHKILKCILIFFKLFPAQNKASNWLT